MNILDLYERLKEKGYSRKWAVISICENEKEEEQLLRCDLELDRKNVFRVWYGTEGDAKLMSASVKYVIDQYDSCIEWLLQNP